MRVLVISSKSATLHRLLRFFKFHHLFVKTSDNFASSIASCRSRSHHVSIIPAKQGVKEHGKKKGNHCQGQILSESNTSSERKLSLSPKYMELFMWMNLLWLPWPLSILTLSSSAETRGPGSCYSNRLTPWMCLV